MRFACFELAISYCASFVYIYSHLLSFYPHLFFYYKKHNINKNNTKLNSFRYQEHTNKSQHYS